MPLGAIGLPRYEHDQTNYFFFDQTYEVCLVQHFLHLLTSTEVGMQTLLRIQSMASAREHVGKSIHFGHGGQSIARIELLAAWWLWRANETNEVTANANLDTFLISDRIDLIATVWVHGTIPEKPIELFGGIILLPTALIPHSSQRSAFRGSTVVGSFGSLPTPSGALMKTCSVSKFISIDPPGEEWTSFGQHTTELTTLAWLMNCLPGTICVPGLATTYNAQHTPLGPLSPKGSSGEIHDVIPWERGILDPKATTAISEAYELFCILPLADQNRFFAALRRLGTSKARCNDDESAADLGIAIESLLANRDERRNKEKRISTRAQFLTSLPRKSVESLVEEIYRFRSDVVHSGSIARGQLSHAAFKEKRARHLEFAEMLFRKVLKTGLFGADIETARQNAEHGRGRGS